MSETRVEFDRVWKKFRKGEPSKRLREAFAGMRRWLFDPNERRLARNEFYSLRDVSLQVRSGECVGIVGPNGAGKSTMLKCASRILRPNRGSVNVKGRVSALIEVGAGFHPELTGRENVYLNGTILGMRRKEIAARFDDIVDFAEMGAFIDTPVKRYSSGMYARLGFAVAAFMDPDVLVIDEVLSVGDRSFARKCEQKIREILAADTAVLFISHNMSAVRMICDRVMVLSGGQVRYEGAPDQAINAYYELIAGDENVGQSHPAIRHLRAQLLDEEGRVTHTASPGDILTVELELVPDEDVKRVSVGFSVRDEHDNEVYVSSMEHLRHPLVDLKAGQTLRTRFQFATNLVGGIYSIGSTVVGSPHSDQRDRVSLDYSPCRAQLQVDGDSEARGSANLFATCVVSSAAKQKPNQLEVV